MGNCLVDFWPREGERERPREGERERGREGDRERERERDFFLLTMEDVSLFRTDDR